MTNKTIIGISGKMGSGKDFVCDNVIIPLLESNPKNKVLKLCFSDQIKINTMTKNNVSFDSLYNNKTKETRLLLQKEGSDARTLDKNIWIKYVHNWIEIFNNRGFNIFVISDIRLLNEIEYINNNNGILFKVVSNTRNLDRLHKETNGDKKILNIIKNHASENEFDKYNNFDLIIDNENENLSTEQIKIGNFLQHLL